MKTTKHFFLIIGLVILGFTSCKKNDPAPSIPQLTTVEVTDIAIPMAKSGGNITGNGGRDITAAGLCWSKTNQTPTISNDTSKVAATSGNFIGSLKNIEPSSTYYVRSYATNEVGTGYGNVVTFTTGNGGPEARNLMITGAVKVSEKLTATYTYFDYENDMAGDVAIQWYRANDASGAGEAAIANATELTYTLTNQDEFKYIRVAITPKASSGTTQGAQFRSSFVGPVAEAPTSVTFSYNGSSVTYGILTSSATGRKWLDRNLGAPNTPTSYNDFSNYGDLFQWGRGTDGHQLINRAAGSAATTAVNGKVAGQSSSDVTGHSSFLVPPSDPWDWRNTRNGNLWQGVSGINNPCPAGWRIPTIAEWNAEAFSGNLEEAFGKLKITMGGQRSGTSGDFLYTDVFGLYWSSTEYFELYGSAIRFTNGGQTTEWADYKAAGLTVRCIKD